jgi:hypothetical protein
MISHYHAVHPELNPARTHTRPDGRLRQEIELVFTDDPDRPSRRALDPAVCALDAHQARELAFELLTLAEVAEQWEQAR